MENDIQEVLLSEQQIQERIRELGRELSEEYAGKDPVIVACSRAWWYSTRI